MTVLYHMIPQHASPCWPIEKRRAKAPPLCSGPRLLDGVRDASGVIYGLHADSVDGTPARCGALTQPLGASLDTCPL